MPAIRSSADLRNKYNEISTFCHQNGEPVFITKNGKGDIAVLSIEAYEQLIGRIELYSRLLEGIDDKKADNQGSFTTDSGSKTLRKSDDPPIKKEYRVNKVGNIFIAFPSDDPWSSVRKVIGTFSDDFMKEHNQPSWDDVPDREDL